MFTWIFGSILVTTWLHFGLPNLPKSFKNPTPRAIKILIDFCFDSFSILAPFWGPCWPPFSSQDAPRRPQDGHKTAQHAPETPKDAQRRPPDAPKAPKTLHCGRFLGDFLEEFAVQPVSSTLHFLIQIGGKLRFGRRWKRRKRKTWGSDDDYRNGKIDF